MDWRKASFSGSGGNCVEVRRDLAALRDSKNPGPALEGDVRQLVMSFVAKLAQDAPKNTTM
jgi:hypothetical protein